MVRVHAIPLVFPLLWGGDGRVLKLLISNLQADENLSLAQTLCYSCKTH